MALTPRLELRQSQSLVMTPQLQQAIKLLQLSNIELASYVEDQIEKNPLLEIDEGADRPAQENTGAPDSGSGDSSDPPDTGRANGEDTSLPSTDQAITDDVSPTDTRAELDTDHDNLYSDEARADVQNGASAAADSAPVTDWSGAKGGDHRFDDDSSFESTLSSTVTLRDHLLEQLGVAFKNQKRRAIGAHLIDTIDEAGYLREPLEEIAARLGADLSDIENILATLQTFDPPGVFSRDLKECLSLQLADRNRLDPAMQHLIENLEMLAKRDLAKLMQICGVDAEDLADMVTEIKELDPKPGHAFGHEIAQTVVPDVFVREQADGGWRVELNSDTLPKVLVNQTYYTQVHQDGANKDAKAYIANCYNDANWLVKSLDQRAKTILKVASEIVRQQDGFLVQGIEHLRPLNLRTIAEAISMHESTVSRVTSNKYMATPRGVFELKYFFTSAIASADGGEAHSAESVRHKIKSLIDNECPTSVLSDDRIVELLKDSGVDIARRTVAKYREALKIPSSVQRRRLKKQSA